MADIQSATAEIRRGKKEERQKSQGKNIVSASAMQGGHKKYVTVSGRPTWTVHFKICALSQIQLLNTMDMTEYITSH